MNRTALLVPAAVLAASAVFAPFAFAAPADPVECESANALVLIRAVAVVDVSTKLDASDQAINDALIANVKAAGVKVDSAVKAIQAVGNGLPIPPALTAALAGAQADLQAASKALADATSSPELEKLLAEAKASLAAAIRVQLGACAEEKTTPAPTTTVTPPPTTVVVPAPPAQTQITRAPGGSVDTGTA